MCGACSNIRLQKHWCQSLQSWHKQNNNVSHWKLKAAPAEFDCLCDTLKSLWCRQWLGCANTHKTLEYALPAAVAVITRGEIENLFVFFLILHMSDGAIKERTLLSKIESINIASPSKMRLCNSSTAESLWRLSKCSKTGELTPDCNLSIEPEDRLRLQSKVSAFCIGVTNVLSTLMLISGSAADRCPE